MSARRTGAVAIGNFDGVHLGHMAVLTRARERAAQAGGRTAVLTFDPHPAAVVRREGAPCLLTPSPERTARLHGLGVDDVHILTFDRTLAALEPDAFVSEVVWPRLRPSWVVVGENFAFGRQKRGGPTDLARLGERLGFAVEVVPPLLADGAPVSSSRVRQRLAEADMAGAERLLGRPYAISGIVVHGAGEGRALGVPTANLVPPPHKCLPPEGIYAARVRLPGGGAALGAADLGRRPTFESDGDLRLEVHLLDSGGPDLYGQTIEIELVRYVRPDRVFADTGALQAAMAEDIRTIRGLLARDAPQR